MAGCRAGVSLNLESMCQRPVAHTRPPGEASSLGQSGRSCVAGATGCSGLFLFSSTFTESLASNWFLNRSCHKEA